MRMLLQGGRQLSQEQGEVTRLEAFSSAARVTSEDRAEHPSMTEHSNEAHENATAGEAGVGHGRKSIKHIIAQSPCFFFLKLRD